MSSTGARLMSGHVAYALALLDPETELELVIGYGRSSLLHGAGEPRALDLSDLAFKSLTEPLSKQEIRTLLARCSLEQGTKQTLVLSQIIAPARRLLMEFQYYSLISEAVSNLSLEDRLKPCLSIAKNHIFLSRDLKIACYMQMRKLFESGYLFLEKSRESMRKILSSFESQVLLDAAVSHPSLPRLTPIFDPKDYKPTIFFSSFSLPLSLPAFRAPTTATVFSRSDRSEDSVGGAGGPYLPLPSGSPPLGGEPSMGSGPVGCTFFPRG